MAFILYKTSTLAERIICLSYPFRPLIQDYLSRENFQQKFSTYVNCYKSVSGSTYNFQWKRIYEFMNVHEDEILNFDNRNFFFYCVIDLLQEFDCNDKCLLSVWVYIYFYILNTVRRRKIKLVELLKQPFLKNVIYNNTSYFSCMSIYQSDVNFVRVLVKYGIMNSIYNDVNEIQIAELTVKRFSLHILRSRRYLDDEGIEDDDSDICQFLQNFIDYMHHQNSSRRILIVLMGLEAVIRKMICPEFLQSYMECLRLYFESVPEPYITQTEMKKLLWSLMVKQNILDVNNHVEDLYREFVELFPETPVVNAPRTLKHLCRCKIRESIFLQKHKTLPEAATTLVKQHYLPSSFRGYILCDVQPTQKFVPHVNYLDLFY